MTAWRAPFGSQTPHSSLPERAQPASTCTVSAPHALQMRCCSARLCACGTQLHLFLPACSSPDERLLLPPVCYLMQCAGGIGGDPSGRGQPNTGIFTVFDPDTRQPYPSVHTPWLGHLLFLGATCQGGATPAARAAGVSAACSRAAPSAMRFAEVVLNTQGGCSANMKVWALTDTSSGQLRVVVLNKDGAMPCNVALGLPAAPAPAPAGAWGSAAVYQLLPGKAGLLSSINTGALWQGVTYYGSRNAMPSSDVLRAQRVTAERAASGGSVFTVAMPAASAALLVINPKAAAGAAAEGPSAA